MKITQNLITQIEDCYNQTTKSTGIQAWLIPRLNENVGLDLNVIAPEIKTLTSYPRVKGLSSLLRLLSVKFEDEVETADSFRLLCEVAVEHLSTLTPRQEDLKLCSPEQFSAFVQELNGVSHALALLIYNGGLKLEDLARDKFQLSKVIDGVIEVSGYGSTTPRTVTSNDSFGLTPELFDEVKEILKGKLYSEDSLGLFVADNLKPFTVRWLFTPSHLRASHAQRLFDEGTSTQEIADIQGVSYTTMSNRLKKYRNAN